MINQNMVPASLVNIVFLSTFALVIDRTIRFKELFGKDYFTIPYPDCLPHLHVLLPDPVLPKSQFIVDGWSETLVSLQVDLLDKLGLQLKYNYPPYGRNPSLELSME